MGLKCFIRGWGQIFDTGAILSELAGEEDLVAESWKSKAFIFFLLSS